VVLLILVALLWVAVLLPGVVGRYTERRPTDSIDKFHRRLRLLEATGPKIITPAFTLRTPRTVVDGVAPRPLARRARTQSSGSQLIVVESSRSDWGGNNQADQRSSDRLGASNPRQSSFEPVVSTGQLRTAVSGVPTGGVPKRPRRSTPASGRRSLARRRRRHVLLTLVVSLVLSALVGSVRTLHTEWVLTGMIGLALVAYVTAALYVQLVAEARPRRHFGGAPRLHQVRTGSWTGQLGRTEAQELVPLARGGRYGLLTEERWGSDPWAAAEHTGEGHSDVDAYADRRASVGA